MISSVFQQVVHLNLAEDCMNKFKSNIEKLCKTEQVCAGSEIPIYIIDFLSELSKVKLNFAPYHTLSHRTCLRRGHTYAIFNTSVPTNINKYLSSIIVSESLLICDYAFQLNGVIWSIISGYHCWQAFLSKCSI